MRTRALQWLLAWFAGACLISDAQDRAELMVDHALTTDVATPHTDWAQPYAGGRTRVLFIVTGQGTLPRECVELIQRFDLEAEAVFWARIVDSTEEHWHGGELGEQRLLELLQQPWDCIVNLEQDVARLSPEAQFRLLEPVAQGAGLVTVKTRDARLLKPANRLPRPDWLQAIRGVEVYRVGKGRGVFIPQRPRITYGEGWEVAYDLWAEQFGRAILWAAGKEPRVALQLDIEKPTVKWSDWTATLSVSAAGALDDRGVEVCTRLRRPSGDEEWLPPRAYHNGEVIRYRLPVLASDQWYADAWLRRDGQVVTWTSLPFTVTSTRRVRAVRLDQAWSEVGGKLQGSVELEGSPLAGEALSLRILDRRRRILVQQGLKATSNSVPFSLPVEEWYPMLVTVDARITAAGQEVHGNGAYANITKRHRDQFNFLVWDVPDGNLAPYAEASLAQHGMTVQLSQGNPPLLAAAYDVAWVPYTTRIQAKRGGNGIMTPFCWNDAAAVQAHVQKKAADYAKARQHGVFVWSLGDEVDTQGCCASPQCAAAYREYLQGEYGDLGRLNQSWGTQFADWSQVGIADPGDLDETEALKAGNTARWFDRQAFKSWNFVRFCGSYRAACEAVDPLAKVGFEGAGLFDRGDDIGLIVGSNTFWSPYPGTADEVIRSIAPRDFPRANWMGYTKDADSLLAKYWRMVVLGMDAVWWWRWDCIGRFHGWLAPDLRPFPAVTEILADTRVVRDGLGDLLLRSTRLDDGIAILYSYPSTLIHKQRGGASFGSYEAAHLGAQTLVRELGLEFRYITDRMVRNGDLDRSAIRVLLLPRAEALSAAEADAITRFVKRGGLVLADVRTGLYDEHCHPRQTDALAELFGVRREQTGDATVADGAALGALKLDPGVQPTTGSVGETVAGVATSITRTLGAGETLFLNADFSACRQLAQAGGAETFATDMALRLARLGIVPEYTLVNRDGGPERGVMISRWQNGDAALFSLFRTGGQPSTVKVLLPRAAAVYDLRQRELVTTGREFTTRLAPNRASFFAVLPAKAPAVAVDLPPTAKRGDVVPATLVVPGAAGLHALRLRATVAGAPLDWLDRIVIVGKEPVRIVLPIAWNDPTGRYDIALADAFTGKAVRASLEVR